MRAPVGNWVNHFIYSNSFVLSFGSTTSFDRLSKIRAFLVQGVVLPFFLSSLPVFRLQSGPSGGELVPFGPESLDGGQGYGAQPFQFPRRRLEQDDSHPHIPGGISPCLWTGGIGHTRGEAGGKWRRVHSNSMSAVSAAQPGEGFLKPKIASGYSLAVRAGFPMGNHSLYRPSVHPVRISMCWLVGYSSAVYLCQVCAYHLLLFQFFSNAGYEVNVVNPLQCAQKHQRPQKQDG